MSDSNLSREQFLGLSALLGAFAGTSSNAAAAPQSDPDHPNRVQRALALSGGGARGAYEAGFIDYLVSSRGIRDGQPLDPYGFICGTSIGALNGYFVATAQYSLLRKLWYTIADAGAVRLKPKFAAATDPTAGLANRTVAAMNLAFGVGKNVTGVLDGPNLRAFLAQYINPSTPLVLPFAWAVTNLTRQAPEYFYLIPPSTDPELHERARNAVRATVGPSATLREATPDLLVDALQASTSIPIAFDPVMLPEPNTLNPQAFVDGGVTANTPIEIARAAALNVDVIMVDPPFQSDTYSNAFEIAFGVFGTMQRSILDAKVRSAYLETVGKRLFLGVPRPVMRNFAESVGINVDQAREFSKLLYASDFFLLRPEKVLPVAVGGFDDRKNIYQTYKLGFADAQKGLTKVEMSLIEV